MEIGGLLFLTGLAFVTWFIGHVARRRGGGAGRLLTILAWGFLGGLIVWALASQDSESRDAQRRAWWIVTGAGFGLLLAMAYVISPPTGGKVKRPKGYVGGKVMSMPEDRTAKK